MLQGKLIFLSKITSHALIHIPLADVKKKISSALGEHEVEVHSSDFCQDGLDVVHPVLFRLFKRRVGALAEAQRCPFAHFYRALEELIVGETLELLVDGV